MIVLRCPTCDGLEFSVDRVLDDEGRTSLYLFCQTCGLLHPFSGWSLYPEEERVIWQYAWQTAYTDHLRRRIDALEIKNLSLRMLLAYHVPDLWTVPTPVKEVTP